MIISKDIIRIVPGTSFEDAIYWLSRVPVNTLCKTPNHMLIKIYQEASIYDEWIVHDLDYTIGTRRVSYIVMNYGAVLLRPKVEP